MSADGKCDLTRRLKR